MLPQRKFSTTSPRTSGPIVYFSYEASLEAQRRARPRIPKLLLLIAATIVVGGAAIFGFGLFGLETVGLRVFEGLIFVVGALLMAPAFAAGSSSNFRSTR